MCFISESWKRSVAPFKYNGERFLYQSTTVAKIDLKTQNIAKLCYFS